MDRREKINELQALVFDDESASDAQKFLAPPKLVILEKKFWQKRENIKKCRKFSKKFGADFPFQKTGVSEELGIFERHWQIPRQKLLPVVH